MNNNELLKRASESESADYFKNWSSQDRRTAFFEAFGRYVKEPSRRDFVTIYHILLWAEHDDKALAITISDTFKWAKLSFYKEYGRWFQ